jgi:hypothetical protein
LVYVSKPPIALLSFLFLHLTPLLAPSFILILALIVVVVVVVVVVVQVVVFNPWLVILDY